MAQGLDSYRNGTKKNWRGWQWNRIVERLLVPVGDAVVLYLCGPEDIDRSKATDRGFRDENLIAVDVEDENVRRVRRAGGLAICHDLLALVASWPDDWPIDVIVADYCAGLNKYTSGLTGVMINAPGFCGRRPGVVAVNLQRGRDAWSSDVRAGIEEGWVEEGFGDLKIPGVDTPKHRGFQFYVGAQALLCSGIDGALRMPPALVHALAAPAFNSYRSNRVWMDSVVMGFPPNRGAKPAVLEKIQKAATGLIRSAMARQLTYAEIDTATARRKIAACRAVRTMKMKATAA